MINSNWARWIYASMSTYFNNVINNQYPIFFIGQRTDPDIINTDHFEFRMNGPDILETCNNLFTLTVNINILISTILDDTDLHKNYRMIGLISSCFADNICIYRYGNQPSDDDSLLETMVLQQNSKKPISIYNFGRVDPSVDVVLSTVEGTYRMIIGLD